MAASQVRLDGIESDRMGVTASIMVRPFYINATSSGPMVQPLIP